MCEFSLLTVCRHHDISAGQVEQSTQAKKTLMNQHCAALSLRVGLVIYSSLATYTSVMFQAETRPT